MVRPEAVNCTSNFAGPGQNVIPGEVTSNVIAGAIARTYVRTRDGQVFVATELTRRAGAAPSGQVSVTFRVEDTLVFGGES